MDIPLVLMRVANHLDHKLVPHLDCSDLMGREGDEATRRSRALAAFCLATLTGVDDVIAASAVVDGYGDQGIDAVLFHKEANRLYIVQSKWRQNGRSSVGTDDAAKFLRGVKLLVAAEFGSFTAKLQARTAEIMDALSRSDVDVVLVLACSSQPDLPADTKADIDSFLAYQNGAIDVDIFKFEWFNLGRIYASISSQSNIRHIRFQIGLSQWGTIKLPYRAYYGQMKLSDLANLIQYDRFLFHKNIRYYKGTTDVNEAMESTLVTDPKHFWYLNNGITILCRRLTKTALNGSSNTWGTFECEDVSVVNGAQTVGVIWNAYRKNTAIFAGSDATVHVRLISLEHCPSDFDLTLTTATNTQNRIEFRDFAALDQTQQRIAREMQMDNRHYAFKSGDSPPAGMQGCDLEEATIAMACASQDMNLAILAKREIGGFWRNLKAPPYTALFNEGLTATELWRAVQVYRAVGEELQRASPENQQIAVHGNRFILFHVFADVGVRQFKNQSVDEGEIVARARLCVPLVLTKVADAIRKKYQGAYLQPLFKNSERCRTLLDDSPNNPSPPNDDLFDWMANKPN